ncbi:MAG: hypothetical protein KDA25_08070 [Phycisphaerales bacterium]|nr:hypothetical protein [Phycisphaerales bacterium]
MIIALLVAGGTVIALLFGTAVLHLIPRLGAFGRGLTDRLCRAPGLDLLITYFTVLPMIVGAVAGWRSGEPGGAWWGLAGGIAGQVGTVLLWSILHSLAHAEARRGPRIIKVLNRIVGPWRNHAALWVTAVVVPLFWAVRLAELFLYPFLVWLVRFPRYVQGEWVNVSRQKFDGLVGHDLIWCLYCDWMTGVWSLGSEMLRNVEAFWCPIRFRSDKKCANCSVDFPDVMTHWIDARGTMDEVTALLEQQYGNDAPNAWFGHPARLTVEGRAVDPA